MRLFRRQPRKNPDLEERIEHLRTTLQSQPWPSTVHRPPDPMQVPEPTHEQASEPPAEEPPRQPDPGPTADTGPETSTAAGPPPAPPPQVHTPPSSSGFTSRASEQFAVPSFSQKGAQKTMEPVRREHLPYPDLAESAAPSPADAVAGGTRIDSRSHFNGTLRSESDIYVEGTVEGEVECAGTLYVEESATVSATVHARSAVIAGHASGDFACEERLIIKATGELRGKAKAPALIVEEGAFFEGEFKMAGGNAGSSPFGSWERSETSPAFSQGKEEV